jgi:hypothetical protein
MNQIDEFTLLMRNSSDHYPFKRSTPTAAVMCTS